MDRNPCRRAARQSRWMQKIPIMTSIVLRTVTPFFLRSRWFPALSRAKSFPPIGMNGMRRRRPPGNPETPFTLESLKGFRQDQIPCYNRYFAKRRIQPVRLWRFSAVEVVDPDGRVHEDHLSDLISSRLPDHLSFPRYFLISFLPLTCTSSFNPSSMASFSFSRRTPRERISSGDRR